MHVLCGLSKKSEFQAHKLVYSGCEYKGIFAYPKLRQKISFVFQNPVHQLFMKTVEEEILLRCPNPKEADEILNIFGIDHLRYRHPYSLSMGEKRRASVAAVAASKAELILLDEPTIGQDYNSLRDMAASLRILQEQTGNTLLISTHDELAVRLFGGKNIDMSRQR
jgi:energy-coupling factor transport system ATP-binding protein